MSKNKLFKTALAAVVCSMLFAACGDDSSSNTKDDSDDKVAVESSASDDDSSSSNGSDEADENVSISDKTISGVSQKGPFITGSSVKVFELDEKFKQTGKSFTGKIEKDDGAFSIESVELASQYAVLEASGYYRNEVTGKKSTGTITLNAITDLSDREKVNVNLLTHLEYDRAMYLVKHDTMSVAEAKIQAENEIFKAFGIEGDFASSEDLNIFSKGNGNAALLAISVLMQADRSEAELTEFLTKFASDIKEDGTWDDEAAKVKIADWAMLTETSGKIDSISKNIASWKLGEVPEFAEYIYKYWTEIYELEACEKDAEGTIVEIKNKSSKNAGSDVRLICKDTKWTYASDLEKDTYGWTAPESKRKAHILKYGEITGATYVYDFKEERWRELNLIEIPKTEIIDSTTVPGKLFISYEESVVAEVCHEFNQGKVVYVAKKQNGGFFCKQTCGGGVGKCQWTPTKEQPTNSKNFGRAGMIFEENYDNLIFCDLEMYVCEDNEWKLTTDTVGIQVPYGPGDENNRVDGELYFASKSLLWFKYDAKQGWGLASKSDVKMSKLLKDEVKLLVPGWYRWNEEKFGNDKAFTNELEGSPADDGWNVDFGSYAYHGYMTEHPGCTIERKGSIVYIKNKEPYQWIKNFQICDVNPLHGADSDPMVGDWNRIDHWQDNMNAKCDKDNLGKRRYGTISKMIEYECVEAKNATYKDFSGEETSFVDGYAWTAIGFIGQEMIDMEDVPCTADNVGKEERGTYSNYWRYTCTEIKSSEPPYYWVKSEKQDTFLVSDAGYGWN